MPTKKKNALSPRNAEWLARKGDGSLEKVNKVIAEANKNASKKPAIVVRRHGIMVKKVALEIDRSDAWKNWESVNYITRSGKAAGKMIIDSLYFNLVEVSKAAKNGRALNGGVCVLGYEVFIHTHAKKLCELWLKTYKMEETKTVNEVKKRRAYHTKKLNELKKF